MSPKERLVKKIIEIFEKFKIQVEEATVDSLFFGNIVDPYINKSLGKLSVVSGKMQSTNNFTNSNMSNDIVLSHPNKSTYISINKGNILPRNEDTNVIHQQAKMTFEGDGFNNHNRNNFVIFDEQKAEDFQSKNSPSNSKLSKINNFTLGSPLKSKRYKVKQFDINDFYIDTLFNLSSGINISRQQALQ